MTQELSFDRRARRQERLAFIREYAAWVKRTPNAEWSKTQGALIDSFMENARNMPLSSQDYLERVIRDGKKKRPSPRSRDHTDPEPCKSVRSKRKAQLLVRARKACHSQSKGSPSADSIREDRDAR